MLMKSKALIAFTIILLAFGTASAQEDVSRQVVVPLERAGFVAFKIEAVPADTQKVTNSALGIRRAFSSQALADDHHVIHRVLVDHEGNFVFGYDLTVEPVVNTKQFRVGVSPLARQFEEQLRARNTSHQSRAPHDLNVATLSSSTETQTLDDGDAFALDLLVNPQTGVKIIDEVKVSFDRSRLWETPFSPPRDFTLDNVELAIRDYRLFVNGQMIAGGKPTSGCAGALAWFYLQHRGRFIFSLFPREGYDFQKVGVIEDNKISFTLRGDRYEWISSAPIISNGGTWNLWVLYDPDYVLPNYSAAAQAQQGESASESSGSNSRLGSLDRALQNAKAKNQSGFNMKSEPQTTQEKTSLKGAYVAIGAADRIENLLPRK